MSALSQSMTNQKATITRIKSEFPVGDLDNAAWKKAKPISITTYWNGAAAPAGRRFSARLLWSEFALYVRFEANQTEPLVVSDKFDLTKKTMNLWDRDVCEIFLGPDAKRTRKYLEFQVAPTREWIDLAIDYSGKERKTDWDFRSEMESAAKLVDETVVMAIKVPWSAFGVTPKSGDVWLGNLLRCVGRDPDRGYLAWQPTMTEKPNFHVPEKFGEFEFVR
jgi:alpha-galactosidase